MLQRLIIAYSILTVGFTGISIGMIANGSAYPGNPAWPFVTAARDIFLGFGVVFAAGAGLLWLFAEAIEKDWKPPNIPGEEKPEEIEAHRKANKAAQEEREKARQVREEEARRQAEVREREQEKAKQRQEELRRQAEEERKLRSAEDAAKSGLDDFL